MPEVKDSKQATVHVGYDGRVHKTFRGPLAERRFQNELRVLKYLEQQNCPFVPRVLEHDASKLYMVTTNVGSIVDKISQSKLDHLFQELEQYGVKHDDPYARNVTYNADMGRFCLIDFEFARIMESGEGFTLEELEELNRGKKYLKAMAELEAIEQEAKEEKQKSQ
ncbi:MAG: serine/threonine protein phosphatase [Puniceicoccaceae bacterium]